MPKFLTICEGGACRSVAMALQLKMTGEQDAVAASWRWNSPETLRALMEWADYVVLMERHFLDRVPGVRDFVEKVRIVDVGPDVYGHPFNMGLNLVLKSVVEDWRSSGWRIKSNVRGCGRYLTNLLDVLY